jgi:hypothetical protein
MSSRHAEHGDEYRRLACVASARLLASRFASQFSDSHRSRQRSLVSLNAGVTVVRVIRRRCFCAHSVDICVEARQVVVPQARPPYRESAHNSRFCFALAGSSRAARRAAESE